MDKAGDTFEFLRHSDPLVLLNANIYSQLALSLTFLLFSFVVANTANMTAVVFTAAAIFIVYPLWAYYAIHRLATHVTVGATLGAGLLVIFLSLQMAVFWGALSVCEKLNYSVRQYSCNSKIAYRVVSIIAIFLFLAQVVFVLLLAHFRLAVLKEVEEYEEISPHEPSYAFDPSDHEAPGPGARGSGTGKGFSDAMPAGNVGTGSGGSGGGRGAGGPTGLGGNGSGNAVRSVDL